MPGSAGEVGRARNERPSVVIQADLGLAEEVGDVDEVRKATVAGDVAAGEHFGVLLGSTQFNPRSGTRLRKIPAPELLEQSESNFMSGTSGAGAIHRNEQPDMLRREEQQIAVKIDGIAAMRNRAETVDALFIKSQCHSVDSGHGDMRGIVHELRRGRLHQSRALIQVRNHEFRHVRRRHSHRAGGRQGNNFIRLGIGGRFGVPF